MQPTLNGGPVEKAVVALDKLYARESAVDAACKSVDRRKRAVGADLIHGAEAGPAGGSRSVKQTVAALNHARAWIAAVNAARKIVDRGQHATRGDLENGTGAVRPAFPCCPIKKAVAALHQL